MDNLKVFVARPDVARARYPLRRCLTHDRRTETGMEIWWGAETFYEMAVFFGFLAASLIGGIFWIFGESALPAVPGLVVVCGIAGLVFSFSKGNPAWCDKSIPSKSPLVEIRDGHLRYRGQSIPVDDLGGLVIFEAREWITMGAEYHIVVDRGGAPLMCLCKGLRSSRSTSMNEDYLARLDSVLFVGVWRIRLGLGAPRLDRMQPIFEKPRSCKTA